MTGALRTTQSSLNKLSRPIAQTHIHTRAHAHTRTLTYTYMHTYTLIWYYWLSYNKVATCALPHEAATQFLISLRKAARSWSSALASGCH